jgi:hypothetical protein
MSNYYSTILALGSSIDPDAQAYIAALVSSGYSPTSTEQGYINDLFVNAKANNWLPDACMYPLLGTINAAQKWNAINPVDTDAAFRLGFNGTISFKDSGITGNGATGFASTFFNMATQNLDSTFSVSIYVRTNLAEQYYDYGTRVGGTAFNNQIIAQWNDLKAYANEGSASLLVSANLSNSYGFYTLVREGNGDLQGKLYKNGNLIATSSFPFNRFESAISYLLAANDGSNAVFHSKRELAFASISKTALSASEVADMYADVQQFQVGFGRQVPPPAPSDADAGAYIQSLTTLGYTPSVSEQNAINDLFLNLKGAGSVNSTDNMYADLLVVRPYYGGLATTNGLNAIRPTTSPTDFYGTFNGGWVHSNAGSKPNGVNAYMGNNLVPSVNIGADTNGGVFCNVKENSDIGMDIGCQTFTNFTGFLIASNFGGQRYSRALTSNQFSVAVPVFRDAVGFYGSIQINGQAYFQRDTILTNYAAGSSGRPDREVLSGAINSNGSPANFTDRRRDFEVIMNNVRDTNRPLILKQIVDAFNTAIGR